MYQVRDNILEYMGYLFPNFRYNKANHGKENFQRIPGDWQINGLSREVDVFEKILKPLLYFQTFQIHYRKIFFMMQLLQTPV